MNTIIAIIFLIGMILVAIELLQNAKDAANSGNGCGCLIAIVFTLAALAFIGTAMSAPIGFILVAIVVIFLFNRN